VSLPWPLGVDDNFFGSLVMGMDWEEVSW